MNFRGVFHSGRPTEAELSARVLLLTARAFGEPVTDRVRKPVNRFFTLSMKTVDMRPTFVDH